MHLGDEMGGGKRVMALVAFCSQMLPGTGTETVVGDVPRGRAGRGGTGDCWAMG